MMLAPDIQAALDATFGAVDSCTPLDAGGMSGATLLAVEARGQRYVLRKSAIARAHTQEITCMRVASDAGAAPEILHLDEANGISIMERVMPKPGFGFDAMRVTNTLQRLHAAPLFPATAPMSTMIAMLEGEVQSRSGVSLPPDVRETIGAMLDRTARYPKDKSCHRDLNPTNILDTGARVYFVDWEVAGADDPYFDLGQLGVFAFSTPERRSELLETYLERPPTDEERMHLAFARIIALGFYAAGNAMAACFAKRPLDFEAEPITLAAFFAKLAAGNPLDPAEMSRAMLTEMRAGAAALD